MVDVIDRLKHEARLLHRKAAEGDAPALARIRKIHEKPGLDDESLRPLVKRRHGLSALARELGFTGWTHAAQVLRGRNSEDFGKLLYPNRCWAHTNIWSANYPEAQRIRQESGGYLLAYRNHYLIVDADYIRTMGLDPADKDWRAIGFDWVRPISPEARGQLYGKLIEIELPSKAG